MGPGKMSDTGNRLPMSIKVGDTILFKEPWSEESKIEEDDKKLFLIEEEDILAIIE